MQVKKEFLIKMHDVSYKCKILYADRDKAIEMGVEAGYYIGLVPYTKDSDNHNDKSIVIHKEFSMLHLVKKTSFESDIILNNIIDKKESLAKTILNNEYTKLHSNVILNKIKNKSITINGKEILKGFNSIAGYSEVKEELLEIIDYVKNPNKYAKLGATLTKGILLYGPPGTGKTHFARCLAEECDFNFLSMSGSEFVEKYQGVGAKRVRELFEKARKQSPSIVFIDEIDAIGAKRADEIGSGERHQTLNQLLVELDGFEKSSDIIIICATNRINILDEALTRAGRLDKHIYIGNPDMETRLQLFDIHTMNKPLSDDVDLNALAKMTYGFSCADIKNICNQASLYAIRNNKDELNQSDFEHSIEVNIAGFTSKSKKLNDDTKQRVAYHEAGHTLTNYLFGSSKIQKVSIIPRGESLGCVMKTSTEDKFLHTKDELLNSIKILLAGKVSEEVKFGNSSTGASNDLKKASSVAFELVSKYGLYDENTLFSYDSPNMPDSLFVEYKNKAEKLLVDCYNETKSLLISKIDILNDISEALLEKEELNLDDIKLIVDNTK